MVPFRDFVLLIGRCHRIHVFPRLPLRVDEHRWIHLSLPPTKHAQTTGSFVVSNLPSAEQNTLTSSRKLWVRPIHSHRGYFQLQLVALELGSAACNMTRSTSAVGHDTDTLQHLVTIVNLSLHNTTSQAGRWGEPISSWWAC